MVFEKQAQSWSCNGTLIQDKKAGLFHGEMKSRKYPFMKNSNDRFPVFFGFFFRDPFIELKEKFDLVLEKILLKVLRRNKQTIINSTDIVQRKSRDLIIITNSHPNTQEANLFWIQKSIL